MVVSADLVAAVVVNRRVGLFSRRIDGVSARYSTNDRGAAESLVLCHPDRVSCLVNPRAMAIFGILAESDDDDRRNVSRSSANRSGAALARIGRVVRGFSGRVCDRICGVSKAASGVCGCGVNKGAKMTE